MLPREFHRNGRDFQRPRIEIVEITPLERNRFRGRKIRLAGEEYFMELRL